MRKSRRPGLKYYVRGGGGPGSLIVQGSVGGAWINAPCLYNPDSTFALRAESQLPEDSLPHRHDELPLARDDMTIHPDSQAPGLLAIHQRPSDE